MADKAKKTKKSRTGAQFYQSDAQKRERLSGNTNTDTDRAIERALYKAMHEGRLAPKEAGRMNADHFIDSLDDAYMNKPVKKAMGGAVKGYMGGGKVRGYKNGGGVCRGGGAAVSGTKFSGVK